MAVSERDSLKAFVAFLKEHGVLVGKVSKSARTYKFVITGDHTKLPDFTRTVLRTFREGDAVCAYVRIKHLRRAITAPPKVRGKWKTRRVKIDGKIVETKVAKTRIPGVAFDGQFRLEKDGRCGVVDYDSSARAYADKVRKRG